MTAITVLPSRIRWISDHTFERYAKWIDAAHPRHIARAAIMRMVQSSHVMTDRELRYHHVKIDAQTTYYLSETSAGRFLIVVRQGVMVTIRPMEIEA